ncbi:pyridoxal phosphate-dependent decarboxylase family protein [Streptomyces purpurogeneiscleroticus]|uniref:pyridoxal phosphate-dependent decarboxylase family protein n=1 Tax=Streptomyces purpurogeneiscleroticus TaxID=68259 RepID=UPI001CBE76F3|nr:aspartate aminotransferase family protein [Streptomyces purpurogeneiscleroticus]MBZ4016487.1 pyridoxal-dependent decarboxylase [Streptomyces purpurogeneiscleroticus]
MTFLAPTGEDPSLAPAPAFTGSKDHLLNNATVQYYRDAVRDGVDRVAARLAATDRPFTGMTADRLTPAVRGIDLEAPLGNAAAALDELEDIYLRDAVYFHHPRYLAHLNCPVVIPAVVAEAVLSAVNSSLDTWDQSAGGTLIEQRLIEWTAGRIGFGDDADGVFTSGGTQSNLQAMLLARDEARRLAREAHPHLDDTEVRTRLRILTSQVSHFSIEKAATLLGLTPEAVVAIPVDDEKRLRTDALEKELTRCAEEGLIPMAVVATAGTTDFGSIDPLPEIAALCAREGVWMHVDAAYGCGLLVSKRRGHLDGIENADSVTVDYHKSFFQPVSSSAVIVRNRTTLRHVTYHADYLNPERMAKKRIPNQVDKSLQTTRRFDALKLWMTLRIMGADRIGELFDDVVDRAADGWKLLDTDDRFEVVTRPTLSTLVFRYVPDRDADPELVDRVNLYAREALAASGEAVIASTVVDGRHYLKFTLLNPETTLGDIAAVLDLIAEHAGSRLAAEATPELTSAH